MKKIKVSDIIIQEAKNIVDGVYSPLGGFLVGKDLDLVLDEARLSDGSVWPMPIVLDISEEEKDEICSEDEIEISDKNDNQKYLLKDIKIHKFDKEKFSEKLFGTVSREHPGVQAVAKMGDWLVGGKIFPKEEVVDKEFYLTPSQTRELFAENGWERIIAFQTRNAPHRSHEHLQRCGLGEVDGLFIQPIIGPKKSGDFADKHIIEAYKILFEKYFPKDKAALGALKTFMRYAGPKEALFHALVRRNFGCTHMIIGRDHAGVGDFYGTYDAQKIFDNFSEKELGVKIIKYDNAAFCKECRSVVFDHDCPHEKEQKIFLSGTELRKKLLDGEKIPEEFMRPEIVEYLMSNRDDLFV